MTDNDHPKTDAATPSPSRKYTPPKMVVLGNVRDLTLGAGSFTTERGGGMVARTM